MDLEASSNTQRQQHAPNGRETHRVPKLRSSCDECSNSKVRCDQGRPSCQRCLYARVHCNYSVSRRMGKPLSSAKNDQSSNARTSTSTPTAAARKPSQISNASSAPVPQSEGGHEKVARQHLGHGAGLGSYSQDYDYTGLNFMIPDVNTIPGNPNSDQLLSASDELLVDDPMSFMNFTNDSPENVSMNKHIPPSAQGREVLDGPPSFRNKTSSDNSGLHVDKGENAFQFPTSPQTHESSSSSNNNNNNNNDNNNNSDQQPQKNTSCVHLTSITLRSLSLPFSYCTNAPSSSPFPFETIDQALATSRRAMTAFNTLIQCPCSHASHAALSLALIILEILVCYSAISRCSTSSFCPSDTPFRLQTPATSISSPSSSSRKDTPFSHPFPSAPPSLSSRGSDVSGSGSANAQKLILDAPISFGDYKIDAEDEQRFILQLILTELRKVARLIDAFAARYCSSGGEDARYAAATNPALASHHRSWNRGEEYVHTALEQFLRTKVYATRKEVSLMLRKLESDEGAMDFED